MIMGNCTDRLVALDNEERDKVSVAMKNPYGRIYQFRWSRTM